MTTAPPSSATLHSIGVNPLQPKHAVRAEIASPRVRLPHLHAPAGLAEAQAPRMGDEVTSRMIAVLLMYERSWR